MRKTIAIEIIWNEIDLDSPDELATVPDDERSVLYATDDDQVEPGWFDWDRKLGGAEVCWRDYEGRKVHNVTHWADFPDHPVQSKAGC